MNFGSDSRVLDIGKTPQMGLVQRREQIRNRMSGLQTQLNEIQREIHACPHDFDPIIWICKKCGVTLIEFHISVTGGKF